jgi:quinol monooxygenase YgiN
MKKNLVLILMVGGLLGFGVSAQAQKTGAAPMKSIHLFDLPDGVTEAQLSGVLRELNATIERLGYKNAGYFLYKAQGEGTEKYRYFFEGIWPSAEAYKKIHDDKAFQEADKKVGAVYEKIKAVELYRRVVRVL